MGGARHGAPPRADCNFPLTRAGSLIESPRHEDTMPLRHRLRPRSLRPDGSSSRAPAQTAPPNPFFAPSPLPFQAPPFDRIKDGDFQPAIVEGMKRELAEIAAIADDPQAPTFANTIEAMERSGELLTRVGQGLLELDRVEHERGASEDPGGGGAALRRAPGRDLPEPEALRAREDPLRPAREPRARRGAEVPPGALRQPVRPRRRAADRDRQGAAARAQPGGIEAHDRVRRTAARRHQRRRVARRKPPGARRDERGGARRGGAGRPRGREARPVAPDPPEHDPAAGPRVASRSRGARAPAPGVARDAETTAARTTRARPSRGWRSCARRRRSCSAFRPRRPSSSTTRWRRRRRTPKS